MRSKVFWGICLFLCLCALTNEGSPRLQAQSGAQSHQKDTSLPPGATRFAPSLPIHIELVPLNQPRVGEVARFEVTIDSSIDPDLVKRSWVEYRKPDRMRRSHEVFDRRELPRRPSRERLEMGVVIPDESRYEIRARLVVELVNGRTIAKTAVRWVDIGGPHPPEGMIGRITNSDGTGIRVYQGATVR